MGSTRMRGDVSLGHHTFVSYYILAVCCTLNRALFFIVTISTELLSALSIIVFFVRLSVCLFLPWVWNRETFDIYLSLRHQKTITYTDF